MRPIVWLHISDIHLRAVNQWSQDVVLQALCRSVEDQREEGTSADFILVSGDIAFAGKREEYALAENFFKELQTATEVPLERFFCVPGNHDINRDRQNMCFRGVLGELNNANKVDVFLGGGEDFETLLTRQENYRAFQDSFFDKQDRHQTQEGLGYISRIAIGEVQLAILALNSAWLAEGGKEDHGRLLIGERQVINAIGMGFHGEHKPHIIVAMAHHPFHLIQEFDRSIVQHRLEEAAHFFHCGHLHEPENRLTGPLGKSCLTVAAGASYETRQSRHAYSIVKLDLLRGIRNISVLRYSPEKGAYFCESTEEYQIELSPIASIGVKDLALAIQNAYPAIEAIANYLAALVLGKKSEFPIPTLIGYNFGSYESLRSLSCGELSRKAEQFITFRNALSLFFDRESLEEILLKYGETVSQFGNALIEECQVDSVLKKRLGEYEADSRRMANGTPRSAFHHSLSLMQDLVEDRNWPLLRGLAERHLTISDLSVNSQVKRMLALALANFEETRDRKKAIELFQELVQCPFLEFSDFGNLAILLLGDGLASDAEEVVLKGIERFPERISYFYEIGQKIVVATGNRSFRKRLENELRLNN